MCTVKKSVNKSFSYILEMKQDIAKFFAVLKSTKIDHYVEIIWKKSDQVDFFQSCLVLYVFREGIFFFMQKKNQISTTGTIFSNTTSATSSNNSTNMGDYDCISVCTNKEGWAPKASFSSRR